MAALRGAKHKDGPKHDPRNRDVHDWTIVPNVPFEGSPNLPDWGIDWHQTARDWYEIVRRLPHAALWDDGDWQFVHQTAVTLHNYATTGTAAQAVEFRQREKDIAVTSIQRRDQRIRYTDPETPREDESPVVLVMPPRLGPNVGG